MDCDKSMHDDQREPEEDEEEDFFEVLLECGQEVAYQDWDSGGPGAGAGRVSVYRYRDRFYVMHDAGLAGPYNTKAEAIRANGVDRETDATVRIWPGDSMRRWRQF